jgi:hypothetical protein
LGRVTGQEAIAACVRGAGDGEGVFVGNTGEGEIRISVGTIVGECVGVLASGVSTTRLVPMPVQATSAVTNTENPNRYLSWLKVTFFLVVLGPLPYYTARYWKVPSAWQNCRAWLDKDQTLCHRVQPRAH